MVTEGGFSIPEVGRRLSVAASTIRYWVKANREGKLKEVGYHEEYILSHDIPDIGRNLAHDLSFPSWL